MGKRDSAPTLGWVIVSKINKWIVILAMIILFVSACGLYVVWSQLREDCSDVYRSDMKVGSYWLHFEAGSTRSGCPLYEP